MSSAERHRTTHCAECYRRETNRSRARPLGDAAAAPRSPFARKQAAGGGSWRNDSSRIGAGMRDYLVAAGLEAISLSAILGRLQGMDGQFEHLLNKLQSLSSSLPAGHDWGRHRFWHGASDADSGSELPLEIVSLFNYL